MPYLVVVRGPDRGRVFEIVGKEVWIGRAFDCEVQILDPGVSRRQCRILREGQRLWLEDRGPVNPTRVDGRVVGRARLRHGARIAVGSTEIVLRARRPHRAERGAEGGEDGGR